MRHIARRFGSRIGRRWVLTGIALLALAGAALLFLPGIWRGGPSLQVVALGADGRFAGAVRIPAAWSDSAESAWGPATRVPLILAVQNTGSRSAHPARLSISIPARFRLVQEGRDSLQPNGTGGSLLQYTLAGPLPPLEPGSRPTPITRGDTLWLQPILPSIYCVAAGDSVPEFVAAPMPDPRTISRLRIFYSLEGGGLKDRQTGLLDVQIDPRVVQMRPAQPLPTFPATVREPEIEPPAMSGLTWVGARTSFCGEPENPTELFTTVWETLEGGRFLALSVSGVERKRLYDLNGDGIVELEMWDPDGDGDFEARREARFAIPSFLLPLRDRLEFFDMSVFAALPADSAAQLNRFHRALTERFVAEPVDTTPRLDRFGRDVVSQPPPAQQERETAPQRARGPRLLGTPVPDR